MQQCPLRCGQAATARRYSVWHWQCSVLGTANAPFTYRLDLAGHHAHTAPKLGPGNVSAPVAD
jgi:hypothetical protein